MRRLFARWFGWRYVLLEHHDGDMELRRAFPTDSGWAARQVIGMPCPYVLLNPDGTTRGKCYIKRWYPFLGWDEAVAKPASDSDRIPLAHPLTL
jgi:hypothetical protein